MQNNQEENFLTEINLFKISQSLMAGLLHDNENVLSNLSFCILRLSRKIKELKLNDSETEELFKDMSDDFKILVTSNRNFKMIFRNSNSSQHRNEKIDLIKIVKSAINYFEKYKTCFKFYFDGNTSYNIYANGYQIEHCIIQILYNAIQSKYPGREIEVLVYLTEEKSNHILEIKDNGKGIDKMYLDRIFNVGYTTKDSAAGIGLAFTKSIMKDHKARIEVSSVIDQGTTFKLIFNKYEKA